MRRVICDIISADERFQVADTAVNGMEALELINKNTYDLVVLDLMMPRMSGVEVMRELNRRKNPVKVVVTSALAGADAGVTVESLALGALDFVKKPVGILDKKGERFARRFTDIITAVVFGGKDDGSADAGMSGTAGALADMSGAETSSGKAHAGRVSGAGKPSAKKGRAGTARIRRAVALASSTGGPKALQIVASGLPRNLDAPVFIVQHMPGGFTATLAERLNKICPLPVHEAQNGMIVEKGHVYVAKGGMHMKILCDGEREKLALTDEPPREGVKPCADYMYESLMTCSYDHITCVVLTGMGADGTKGISNLKRKKSLYVIGQDEASCAVYGMPRCVAEAGLVDEVVPLSGVAEAIKKNVGVN